MTAAAGAGAWGAAVGCACAAGAPPFDAMAGTVPVCTTILRGALPTGMVSVTVLLVRSTIETLLETSLVTYAKWLSDVAAIQCGMSPTFTVPVLAYVSGSNRSNSPGP